MIKLREQLNIAIEDNAKFFFNAGMETRKKWDDVGILDFLA